LIGHPPSLLFDPNHAAPTISPFLTPIAMSGVDVWLRHADGPSVCFEISAVPLYREDGVWCGARGICRDVTEDRRNSAFLAKHRSNERLITRISEIFRQKSKPEELLMAAAEACMQGLAANGCQIVGIADEDDRPGSIGAPLAMVGVCGDDSDGAGWKMLQEGFEAEAEFHIGRRHDWSVLRAPAIYAGRTVGAILLWRTPTQPIWSEDDAHLVANLGGHLAAAMMQRADYLRLLNAARTDPLTGIFNRRAFDDELARRLHRLNRDRRRGSLLYIDLDNFKVVNDIRGHDIGDDALRHVADILRANTRGTDLLARLGGDEFVIWLEDVTEKDAIKRAKLFLAAATSLSAYSGSSASPLQMSIGIALYDPTNSETVAGLMKRADNAMYRSKQSGKGTYAIALPPGDAE
jgi:diguanylate cyclase (GGDEF)-like protein